MSSLILENTESKFAFKWMVPGAAGERGEIAPARTGLDRGPTAEFSRRVMGAPRRAARVGPRARRARATGRAAPPLATARRARGTAIPTAIVLVS